MKKTILAKLAAFALALVLPNVALANEPRAPLSESTVGPVTNVDFAGGPKGDRGGKHHGKKHPKKHGKKKHGKRRHGKRTRRHHRHDRKHDRRDRRGR